MSFALRLGSLQNAHWHNKHWWIQQAKTNNHNIVKFMFISNLTFDLMHILLFAASFIG